jgi:beta-glucanase (GH16 family)
MTNIPQLGRGFIPNNRAAAVAGMSIAVFLVCLIVGLSLSSTDGDEAQNASKVETATTELTVPNSPAFPKSLGMHWTMVTRASTDFTGKSVDKSTWDVYDSKGNGGVGWRRPSAIAVESNALRIKAKGDVSGGLSQKFSQTYGRWVVRAKMEKGNGYGPALLLWPDSENWPEDGEIDFLELPKGDRSEALMTSHWGADNAQASHGVTGDYSQWHTYTVDWLPDRLVFYIDDIEQWRVTDPAAIPTKPMHLALQNDIGACNDGWIGCRDASTPATVSLWVSSVRVYSPS